MVRVLLSVLKKKREKIELKSSQEESDRMEGGEKQKIDIYKEIEMSDERSGRLWYFKLKN